ncbi:unnamed protein product [Rhizophagus irregularis]|nr:unnamed protein product [Rhizophagus irregularis]
MICGQLGKLVRSVSKHYIADFLEDHHLDVYKQITKRKSFDHAAASANPIYQERKNIWRSVSKNLLTALKEWEEAGEPFEDDDELAFIEYKESKAYKNGERPGSFGEILRTNSAGFTPTRMIRPGRRARLLPPESENNPIPPHIIVVNIVIKNSETKSISNSINAHDQNAKRSE